MINKLRNNWRLSLALMLSCAALWAQQPIKIVDSTTTSQGAAVSGAGAVKVDGSAVTQPVSGTVTANFAPSTSSGVALTRVHNSSAAAANAKASAGNLYGLAVGNSGNIACWLQVFNTAGTPTAGTSVVDSFMVQAGQTVVIPPGAFALENFATGIGYAGATTDSGATTTGCTTTFSVSLYIQ